ncbi:MAG: hypothetical protein HY738_05935 [Bacteroidia bacterium]|nr:hypothetical protein [Bacteroidia bacterium]
MKNLTISAAFIILLAFHQCTSETKQASTKESSEALVFNTGITMENIEKVKGLLIAKYGRKQQFRIERGVSQTALYWTPNDGTVNDFENFCLENFINSETELDNLFNIVSHNLEILYGNFNKINVDLKKPLHENTCELFPIDMIFGSYDPSSHIEEDFYKNKIAFHITLNFPFYSLKEKSELGKNWSRKEWAYARAGDIFLSRIPPELVQQYADATTKADTYISEYNIYMGNLRNNKDQVLFPEDLKLISHWGLRDELKSNYNTENGFEKQKIIYKVMKRIISQEIPEDVINSRKYIWYPVENKLKKDNVEIKFKPEPTTRYQHLLNTFRTLKEMDKYCPQFPTYISRKFEKDMEIPFEEVEKLFISLLTSKQVKEVAAVISKRLGRNLESFDIWYNGFTLRNAVAETELDKITTSKYPNTDAFQNDLPNLLQKLGFSKENTMRICSKIEVDAARGAGHAWGAEMKSDVVHLRTRIPETGMDFKGYNIAVHEFGHNVEQTLTLQDIDYYLLRGVPNTAFTEAIAFIFQKRDLELLDINTKNSEKDNLMALDIFWSSYEIMGVSLVDMYVWKWLYENPEANAEQLKNAVINIAKEVWNKYYADVFGVSDELILAIYSHMIDSPLYLCAYPVGHIIDFQIEKHIKGKAFAEEIPRILSNGRIVPQLCYKI